MMARPATGTPIAADSRLMGTPIPHSSPAISLEDDLVTFMHDPLGFVLWAFPWGEAGTELEKFDGPEKWQTEVLTEMGDRLRAGENALNVVATVIGIVMLLAVASGHGVGKSALVCWVILWALCTLVDTNGIVTANTETQLRTKTWPQLVKWHRMCICRSMFMVTATAIYSTDKLHEKTWRVDMVPWSEKNTEAFAGLHNQGKRIILVIDEGSAVPDVIYETSEGALTDADTEIIWLVCGNPTRNVGRFRDCFESLAHRWWHMQVDSRTVSLSNKEQIKAWADDYGDDSDFFRVRVRGVFPRAGAMQLIPSDVVDRAMNMEAPAISIYDPLVQGVDVARFGNNASVIALRKGRDARTHPWQRYMGLDTMQLASRVADTQQYFKTDAEFIDGGGVGGGVVDRCRQLKVPNVIEVNFGSKPDGISIDNAHNNYANKRAEMWGNMRDWLVAGGAVPNEPGLRKQLIQQTYEFVVRGNKDCIILTSKEAMINDGLESPDDGDALALTFAYPVEKNLDAGYAAKKSSRNVVQDYDPYAVNEQLDQLNV